MITLRPRTVPLVRFIALLLGLLALSGCSSLAATEFATPFPEEFLPTYVALTLQAENQPAGVQASPTGPSTPEEVPPVEPTPSPSSLPGSDPTVEDIPTDGPAPTPEPDQTPTQAPKPELPPAGVQIINPGPASKVVSPLDVYVNLRPGSRGNVIFELLGEDGRLLVREVRLVNPDRRLGVTAELEFEIPVVAEAGRLVVSSEDTQGRVVVLSSVDLLLLSIGQDDINPGGALPETIIIREPALNSLIQGGTLIVSGIAKPAEGEQLTIELIADDGRRLINPRRVTVASEEENSYSEFSIEVPYSVAETTWVLVTVSESAGRIPGITHLSSVRVLLSP